MSKRADIKTGFLCNCNCLFCVQGCNKKHGNRTKEKIFEDMEEAKKNGCTGVVLTGGEVTIRSDVLELIKYAKRLKFEIIQVQSNGRRFYYKNFCIKAIEAGMTLFAPSVHGHRSELHDSLVRAEGAFDQVTAAIKNMKKLGIRVVTNTVIVKPNYKYLPDIARMLTKLRVDQFQLAFVHALGNADENFEEIVPKVSLAAPYVHKALQIGINQGIKVMAEAMPYCLMQGYEKYVSELYIPETEIRKLDSVDLDFGYTRKYHGKMKFEQCNNCKYDFICEGPWKEYPEKMGNKEFVPVLGNKITTQNELLS